MVPTFPYGISLFLSTTKTYYLREVPGDFTPPVDDEAVELQRYTPDERYNHPVTIGEFFRRQSKHNCT